MVSPATMASRARTSDRDDGVRVVRTGRARRDLYGVALIGAGLVAGALVLRSGARAPEAPARPEATDRAASAGATAAGSQPQAKAPAPTGASGAPPATASGGSDDAMPTRMPKTRAGQLRALRRLGIAPTPGPDGKPHLDAAPVIDALHAAGVHDGIAAFPPPGTDPPKTGIIVPDDWTPPEGYVRHYQTTDDGEPLPPILMFHPDYDFTDADGRPVAIPPDRVVPPEMAPPGLPVEMLHVPARRN
jgi:hypothetical protein